MSTAANCLWVPSEHHDQRLDNFLFTRLKGVPKSCLYRLLRQGKIRVNKKRQKPTYRLHTEDCIRLPHLEINEVQVVAKPSYSLQNTLKNAILFENEGFLILNKPHGLAVHGGSGISLGVIESLRQMYDKNAYLELVHRLDRDTSGCLIIAKKTSSLKNLHALFRDKKIKKTYLMLTKGRFPSTLTRINEPLEKNRLQSGERIVKISAEGQPSVTQFKVKKHFQTSSLVEAIPHTGRTHQIRVHAQYAGHPIACDEKYGDRYFNQTIRTKGLKRLFLHAYQLEFNCPTTNQLIKVTADLPKELTAILDQSR